LPGDGSFKKICFVDSDTGWAVGENGTILHTVDGGQSWIKQVSGTSLVLFDVQFFDKSVGYIIGGDNQDEDGGFRGHFTSILLRTDDGGENWNSVNIPTRNLHWSLSFADRQTGWLLGWDPSAFNQTVVYHTTDGGATWEQNPVAIDPEGTGMFDISMLSIVDKSNIWGIGEHLVRHSTDGGATWDIAYRKTRNAYSAFNDSVQFIDSSTGWACERIDCGGDAIIEPDVSDCEMGNYTFMLRTTDGGSTWQRNRAPRGDVFISFRFLDRCVGIAAGRYYSGEHLTNIAGAVYLTTDGGETWSQAYRQEGEFFRSVFTLEDGTCWVLGKTTLLRCKLPSSTQRRHGVQGLLERR
jgi:photosystem II stability/assembly factor-like uncharacterized protein